MKVLPRSIEEIAHRLERDIQEVAAAAAALGIQSVPTHVSLATGEAWRLFSHLQDGGEALQSPRPEIDNADFPGGLPRMESGMLAIEEHPGFMAQQLAHREQKISELESELLSARADIRSLKLAVDDLERRAQQLRESLTTSSRELAAAQERHISLGEDLDKVQLAASKEACRLNRRVNRLDDINRALRLKMQRRDGDKQRLKASQERVNRLGERGRKLQQQLRVARAAARLAGANKLQLKKQVERLEATNEKLTKSLAKLERSYALLESRAEQAEATAKRSRPPRLIGKRKGLVQREAINPKRSRPAWAGKQLAGQALYSAWLNSIKSRRKVVFRRETIVLIGTDPFTARKLKGALATSQCSFKKPGSADAGVIIVGREGWLVDDIEDQIKARVGNTLRIYSQEMAQLAIEHGHDPFDTASVALLKKFAAGHPALQYLIEDGFMWPEIDTTRIAERLQNTWNERAGESPLHKMGYQVGKTRGISSKQRREVLKDAFRGKIPFAVSKDYMLQWGIPGSRRRLRRIATHIRWIAGGAHGREQQLGHDMGIALAHWSEDLNWMWLHLYEDWMRFRWPNVTV